MEKGAASNHIIISSNYHKFLSSYCHSLAEQCYTPARVYLQLPPGNSPVGSSYFFCIESVPWGSSCSQDQINPFPDRAEGNPPPSTRCQQLQGQTSSLALHLWLSPEFSYLPLAFNCLWKCGLSRTQELYLCAVLLFLVGQRCIGISSLMGRQNNRDVPHLCNKHTLPSCTTLTLWNPIMDQTSKNPSKQAELHHWRACPAHVTQIWWQAIKSQSTHLSWWTP